METAKINLKHNALLPAVVSFAIIILIPFMVGTVNLDSYNAAIPMEMFASLIGIVMLTPVFLPEQNADIDDLVSSKYVSASKIYMLRTICSILIIISFICLFAAYMKIRSCDVTWKLVVGTLADAVFLGALGMLAASICNNTVIAYMPPIVFYTLNYGTGYKMGNYWLFSMTNGQFTPKLWLLATGIVLMAVSIMLRAVRRKILF